MKNAERIVILAILVFLVGGAVWGYQSVVREREDFRARVAAGEFEIPDAGTVTVSGGTSTDLSNIPESEWRTVYPVTYPMRIGSTSVQASVADTLSQRITGLSDTPYLPAGVVKLFAFGVPGQHSIWMKDMNYPIDIIWADEAGVIVHIEPNVSPDTYDPVTPRNSQSFRAPTANAWFVVETNAGFVAAEGIERGDTIVIPRGN